MRRWDEVTLCPLPWREPLEVLSGFAREPWALGLLSGGSGWSYLARAPEACVVTHGGGDEDPLVALGELCAGGESAKEGGPPFQGGVAGLLGYGLGARLEPSAGVASGPWPEAAFALYPALLAFHHDDRRLVAVGRGEDAEAAQRRAAAAAEWMRLTPAPVMDGPLARGFTEDEGAEAYGGRAAEVVGRIRAGELFQANIARGWRAHLEAPADPFDLFARMQRSSPAPFGAYLRLADRAVVSNSPERFVGVSGRDRRVETRPIKGTRPRGRTSQEDAALVRALVRSEKDRAENLMIVDLMRNDLARVCAAGSVETTELFALETYANVHHLVSTVAGRLEAGRGAADLLRAAFPPGSVTGAPKVQAMRVIGEHEPPRGPYCGSMFWAGFDGAFDSSVLIRTAACVRTDAGWEVEARAGAGITTDSDPAAEAEETEAKIGAIRAALVGG